MADDTIDANKFAAQLVIQATEKAIASVGAPVADRARRMLQALSNAYAPFLEKTFTKVSTIRTFLRPNDSVDLMSNYIPVGLTDKVRDFDVDEVVEGLSSGGFYVVSGLAGRGKSVLTRYIALSMYHSPRGRIPLFLELRSLNSLSSKNILQLIHSQYKGDSNIGFNDFKEALSRGYFALILDGFDEIAPDDRDNVEGQIIDLAATYSKLSVIVSGRPYERYAAWERYTTVHLKPMVLAQTRALIRSAPYDEDVKKVFLKRLTEDFFEKHESFLNTPLLAIMLMITFEQYAEIPHSLHEFYRNAFDTLIRRHDAMKAQFLRKTHSGCAAEEFKRVFSSFCLLTYSKSAFSFDRDEVVEYIKIALKQQGMRNNAGRVLDDLIESICLLQEEGFEISFVHRSFQEYFCALFVSQATSGLVKKYLESGKFRIQDDVIPMLYGMVPERVENEWANETTKSICDRFSESDHDSGWKFAMERFPEIEFYITAAGVGPMILSDSELANQVMIIERIYPAHFFALRERRREILDTEGLKKWRQDLRDIVIRLEEEGDPQFKGIKAAIESFKTGKPASAIEFRVVLHSGHKELISKVYTNVGEELIVLRSIMKDQRARIRGSDSFLKEVFAA